jgi:hypothetical protein
MGSAHTTIEVQKRCSLYAGAAVPFPPQALVPSIPQRSTDASARDKQKARSTAEGGCPSKSRKERACNWTLLEILDMVATKRQEFLEDIEVEDVWKIMHPEFIKSGKIAIKVNEACKVKGGHVP